METLNYKCPNCLAGLVFDSKTQKMKCEYCGSSYSLDELDQRLEQEENIKEDTGTHWDGFDPEQWQSDEQANMAVWNCPSCGAEILAEKTTGAVVCPYCDNPMIMPEQFAERFRPDYVIPFKKSRKEATEALKNHYKGKPLLPKVFQQESHLEELKAVYVPFWLFDLDGAGRFRYEATRSRVWEDPDHTYIETSHYHVVRSGKMKFEKIPVDGSKVIDDTMMEAIEPFDYEELTDFNLSYLSGYIADKYDREPDELTDRVHQRMEQSMKDSFRDTVIGYDTVFPKQEKITVTEKGKVNYALFPVWFLNTEWNGKKYSFAMNGQTGRLIGDLPIAKDLAVKYWLKHHIPFTILMTVILTFLRMAGVLDRTTGQGIGSDLLVSFGCMAVLTLSMTLYQLHKMKTRIQQPNAGMYITSGGLHLTESRDQFLYKTVTRKEKPKNNKPDHHSGNPRPGNHPPRNPRPRQGRPGRGR